MINLRHVSFSYEQGTGENGLEHIDLPINEGEVILLCGESGCGKTTLTRLVNGLIPHYYEGRLTGEILINGEEIHKLPLYSIAKRVGSVFQNPRAQFFNVDTTSELAFGCENQGMSVQEIEKRIASTVSELKIHHLIDRSIFRLSGGEKQKIACASVAACHPDIFVLDEPSSNLDISAIEDLRKMIALWKSKGKTVIIAEHRLYFLRELADRILYMKKGKIETEFHKQEIEQLSNEALSDLGLRAFYLKDLAREKRPAAAFKEELRLSHFVFGYKGQPSVINIHQLTVPKESVVAVIGHNGAGKSTFARCLCGLEKNCKGILEMNGKVYKTKERLKSCYMVMQDVNHQLFTESVLDEVLLSMTEGSKEQAEEILLDLDLLHMKDLHPMGLSGGEKQRVAIASAAAAQKEIILFDEPTSGLDLRHMREVSDCLRKLNDMGKTLFVISHDLEFILKTCTHVLHFEKGRVIENYILDDEGEQKLKGFFI